MRLWLLHIKRDIDKEEHIQKTAKEELKNLMSAHLEKSGENLKCDLKTEHH